MKSTDRLLAKRYARAYDKLSPDNASALQAAQQLAAAAQALRVAQAYMRDPAVCPAAKKELVHAAFAQQPQVEKFLQTLVSAKRYYLLEACADEVQKLTDRRQGIVRAQVQSAFALSDEQKKKTEEVLSTFCGKKVRAQFEVQPQLLGGLRIRTQDTLIDGSLQGKFKKLQEQLSK